MNPSLEWIKSLAVGSNIRENRVDVDSTDTDDVVARHD